MPYGKEAKEALLKLVQGKSLKVHVYDEDRYGRCVGDIYCDGVFVQVGLPSLACLLENYLFQFRQKKLKRERNCLFHWNMRATDKQVA